jgi:hypothetical protein
MRRTYESKPQGGLAMLKNGRLIQFLVLAIVSWPSIGRAAAPLEQWQYGELRYDERIVIHDDAGKAVPRVLWITTEGIISGAEWTGLAKKLNIPISKVNVPKEADDVDIVRLSIFNFLGEQGWDMCSSVSNYHGTTHWWFKRKTVVANAK